MVDGAELLGHESGYLWIVFYSHGKQHTHFALIHADGTSLAEPVAHRVIQGDRDCNGSLHTFEYLAPPAPGPDREALATAAVERYRKWLAAECGYIQLDGLPADTNLAALRMKLERLFEPLKVVVETPDPSHSETQEQKKRESIVPVGTFLADHLRFSLLAKPGGGKSTLLKRLAVAYAESDRLHDADEGLPK